MCARVLSLEWRLMGAETERSLLFLIKRRLRGQSLVDRLGDAKDQGLPSDRLPEKSTDVLLDMLVNANNPSKLLEIFGLNKSALNGSHVIAALARLAQLNKSVLLNDQQDSLSVAVTVGADSQPQMREALLSALCGRLVQKSRQLNPNELVNALKNLLALGVSPHSVTFQTVLQHLRIDINDLNLKQLVFLDFLLEKVTRNADTWTGLMASIREAIPLVVRNNLRLQVNVEDVQELLQLLEFCTKHKFHWKPLQILAKALKAHCPLSLEDSMNVMFSVGTFVRYDSTSALVVNPIVQSAVNVACLNLHQIEEKVLQSLIWRLSQRGFYIETLFSACCTRVLQAHKDLSLASVSRYMSAFATVRHVDMKMLDEYCHRLSTVNRDCIETISANEIVTPFAVANYSTPLVRSILAQWCSRQSPLKWNANISEAFRLLINLAIVRCDSSSFELPVHLQSVSTLLDFVRPYETEDACSLLRDGLLLQQLKRLRSGDISPSNEDEESTAAVAKLLNQTSTKRHVLVNCPFGSVLRRAVGSNYVVCDGLISARTGISFDHLLVPHSRWEAVGYTPDDRFEPGVLVPSTFEMVLPNEKNATVVVLVRSRTDYAANAPRLLGRLALETDVLSCMGHRVVQISSEQWNEMPEYERIPYLRANIDKAETL